MSCVKLQIIKTMSRAGQAGETNRCTHQSCTSFGKTVSTETCAQCPLRINTDIRPQGYTEKPVSQRDFEQPIIDSKGCIIYPQTGWEPPVVPAGYKRLDENIRSPGAWIFVPDWPTCQDREMANTVRPCGCVQIHAMCMSNASDKKGLELAPTDCVNCPVRRLPCAGLD
jgi:hypothetical protein